MALPKQGILFAFDFDDTILDDNTDVFIVKMIKGGVPQSIKAFYTKGDWTNYMCEIFKHLHRTGVGPNEMNDFIKNMEFAPGMKELCQNINGLGCDQIIISDSNSVFIDTILKNAGLNGVFSAIFTNPAKFDNEGLLSVGYYHHQDWCSISAQNMCKGHILQEYIGKREKEGKVYDRVIYVGDGSNDLCPGTRLKKTDILCARSGYRLDRLLQRPEEKAKVKAECRSYHDGQEIWRWILDHFESTDGQLSMDAVE